MTLRMADSAESLALAGLDVEAFAAYVDGGIGDQPNAAKVAAAHPGARHLSIALSAARDADCLDVENGAASPADVAGWLTRQRQRGIVRPCLYASVSVMRDSILPLGRALGPSVRFWTAHYGQGEHICGPHSCGELPVDADGTQWTDAYHAPGGVVDMSLLADNFFNVDPGAWTFSPVRGLTAMPGHTSVLLSWSSPGQPAPGAVHHYQVTVRSGGRDVASYPRDVAKAGNPQSWQGGSLEPGTAYTALVRAVAADGGHASPWAMTAFTTGTLCSACCSPTGSVAARSARWRRGWPLSASGGCCTGRSPVSACRARCRARGGPWGARTGVRWVTSGGCSRRAGGPK